MSSPISAVDIRNLSKTDNGCNEKKVKSSPLKWSCSLPGVTLTIWIQISPYITKVKVGNHTFNNFSCFRVIYMPIVLINQEEKKYFHKNVTLGENPSEHPAQVVK